MGAPAAALTAFEVAVRGRGAALSGLDAVGVHRQAHRAALQAPFEAGLDEDLVQTFLLGLGLHQAGARHDHRRDVRRDLAALGDLGGGAEILYAAVGARADEHAIDRHVDQARARGQAHIGQRPGPGLAAVLVRRIGRVGNDVGDRQRVLRARSPRHHRRNVRGVEVELNVEVRALVGRQAPPLAEREVPRPALRREGAALQVLEGRLVRRDQAGAGARLDRHVADRHAAFHRELADGAAGILDHVAGAAGRAELADDGEDDVLGGDAERQAAFDRHAHVLGRLLDQRLRGEHVLDLGGADAEGQRAERAVRGGVAVAAHDRHARQGQALLGADHVHDAAARIVQAEVGHVEVGDVLLERLDLDARLLVLDALAEVRGRRVVVGDRNRGVGTAHRASRHAQALEGLRAGHLVDEVTIDVDDTGPVVLAMNDVAVPDLLEQGPRWRRRGRRRGRLLAERHGAPATSFRRPWRRGRSSLPSAFPS